jgi:hypothetical protein
MWPAGFDRPHAIREQVVGYMDTRRSIDAEIEEAHAPAQRQRILPAVDDAAPTDVEPPPGRPNVT